MPTQWAHGIYWNTSDTNVAPARIGRGGYPAWQASVILGSGFGPIGAFLSTKWAELKWWLRFRRRYQALAPSRQAVLLYTLDCLERPEYTSARVAVAETAHTLGFNRPETWIHYSRMLKDDLGRQENHYRHIRSVVRTRELLKPSTISNPLVNFVTELAYQEYAIQPWP